MRIRLACALLLLMLIGLPGCVERRMIITSEPVGGTPDGRDLGAIVYDEKDQPIGTAPVDKPFTYYGKYRFRLAKDGYETQVVEQRVRAPWYELPGLDFIAENLIPWTIRDVRYYRYSLQRTQIRPPEEIFAEAERMRAYGKTIGDPAPGPDAPPPTVLFPPLKN